MIPCLSHFNMMVILLNEVIKIFRGTYVLKDTDGIIIRVALTSIGEITMEGGGTCGNSLC